jgi:AAA+ ATPase superfamily predicted ATPase
VDLIESERYTELLRIIKGDLFTFVSMEFEQMVRQVLKSGFPRVGSWWNRRGDEIDVLAIDSKKRIVIFGEVKWTNRKMGLDRVEALVAKSDLVKGFSRYEKRFLLVSKSGFTSGCRKRMTQEGIVNWDLNSFSKFLGNPPDLVPRYFS